MPFTYYSVYKDLARQNEENKGVGNAMAVDFGRLVCIQFYQKKVETLSVTKVLRTSS